MHRTNYRNKFILVCLTIFIIGIMNIGYAAQPIVTLNGSGTVLIGDTRVFVASGGTAPYTWSIKTVTGAPGILANYTGATVSFLATVDPGTCYLIVTDNTGAANTTNNVFVVPAPKPIKAVWIQGTSVSTQSDATTVITIASTHQVRDVLFLVKGGSGTITFTKLDWLTNIAKNLNTNVRIHPWVICFSDSSSAGLGIYTTVGGSWISPRDPRYRSYLINTCIIPLAQNHPDISGIHLDCYRYPGSGSGAAYNNDTGLSLVQFCQEVVTTVRKYNPAIPISIAPMPEIPDDNNERYYGQSYYKLSTAGCRFFGVMSYSGNYFANADWVGMVSGYIRDTALRTCAVYAGEQFTYDWVTNGSIYMPSTEIAAETKSAVDFGAQGVCAFRWPIQSYQWTSWDTVGTTGQYTFAPLGAFSIPMGTDTIISLSGGWKPYARWTTSNWSIGSVAVFYGDDSIRFFARNTGTCTVSVRDSAPGPQIMTSGVITVTASLSLGISPNNSFSMTLGSNTVFIATGGYPPYSKWTTNNWSIATVAPLSGTSTQLFTLGLGTVIVSVSDSSSTTANSGAIAIIPPTLTISPNNAFSIPLGSSTIFRINGGILPYSRFTTSNWSIATVAPSSNSTFILFATNTGIVTASASDSVSQTVTSGLITVAPPPSIIPAGAANIRIGENLQFSVAGGISPYSGWTTSSWSIATTAPSSGSTTRVYGVNVGTITFSVKDAAMQVASSDTITVLPYLLVISPNTTITKVVGSSIDFIVSGGTPPYSGWTTSDWTVGTVSSFSGASVRFSALNPGMVNVSVHDSGSQTAYSGSIIVIPLPSITPSTPFHIMVGRSTVLRVSGGYPPYSGWTTSNWNIATLSLSNNSTVTLNALNTGTITVSVHDSNSNTATTGIITVVIFTEAPLQPDRDEYPLRSKWLNHSLLFSEGEHK
ncbi:MAG: hypothetical protein ACE14V_07405 [bacterium]